MQVKTFPVILNDSYMLTPNVKHFIFKTVNNEPFNYQPGQFITIHFERDGKIIRRSYSIANVPEQNNLIEFAAGFVEGGPGTDFLFNLKAGDSININGPFGRLILKEEVPNRYIMVATSTGITPYRAMINEFKKRLIANPTLKIVILQGVQKRADVLYSDEFLELSKLFPQVSFSAHLSREEDKELEAHEVKGYVQTAFPKLNLDPKGDSVYLCGNPGMIDNAFAYLQDNGFAMQQIIREKYISTGSR